MAKQHESWDMLCAALELETKERAFYEKAVEACPSELGKEVFRMLLAEEMDHAEGIKEIQDALGAGEGWPESCKILDRKHEDPGEIFGRIARQHSSEISKGAAAPDLLQVGVDLERASIKFYSDQLKQATTSTARQFLEKMVQEEKGHHLLLLDMQFYYSDPEGYFMEKERRGLDGA